VRDVVLDGHKGGVARAEHGVVAREHDLAPMIEPDSLGKGAREATQDEQVDTDANGQDYPRPWRVVAKRLVVRPAVLGPRVYGGFSAAESAGDGRFRKPTGARACGSVVHA